jgi:hypothetical protein
MNPVSTWRKKVMAVGYCLFFLGAVLSITLHEALGYLMYVGVVVFVVGGALWFKAKYL